MFLEATLRLVGAASAPLSGSQADALQKLVFDWVLRGDTFVDPRHAELLRPREQARPPPGLVWPPRELFSEILGVASDMHCPIFNGILGVFCGFRDVLAVV